MITLWDPTMSMKFRSKQNRSYFPFLYQVERKNWTFERFLTAHKDQSTILEGLTDHGYCGLDARTKVTRLLDGVKHT